MASSPPSSKKQKTLHFPTSTFPTPSRPRGPRQTSLNSFLTASPTAAKKPSPAKTTTPKAKNASILNFFKPVPGSGGKSKHAHKDDALFLATGGYELDLSEPEEDADEEVIAELRRKVREEVAARERMVRGVGQLEMEDARGEGEGGSVMPDVPTETEATHERKRRSPSEDEEEDQASPYFASKPAAGETEAAAEHPASTADETEEPPDGPEQKEPPKFDPAALKLNLSSSMLFSKKLAVGQEKR